MTKNGDIGQEDAQMTSDGTVLMSIPIITSIDGSEVNIAGIKREDDEDLDDMMKAADEDDVDVNQMLSVVNADLKRANHTTLQTLLSSPISNSDDSIQVITLPSSADFLNMGLTTDGGDRLVHMVPTNTDMNSLGTKYIGLIAITNPNILTNVKEIGFSGFEMLHAGNDSSSLQASSMDNMAAILMPPPPINCPAWAMKLKKCEKIGDSYRGYVESEPELDTLLTQHKQQTNSFWGTRQSPSPAKSSTRLMWKSQYVPFDGIPFVNAGSRAVVMECQYGPRRRGTLGKRGTSQNSSGEFKQTCPARIYIKKVRKFPSHAVNLSLDKKSIRLAMDKAFHELREHGLNQWGEERFYVQLPTEKAHDYHDHQSKVDNVVDVALEEPVNLSDDMSQCRTVEARIHPEVLEKLRQLVAAGETRLYTIRKHLRKFVLRELSQCTGHVPERHDLTMFPTVNDLKNHIHQALKDITNGILPINTQMVMPMNDAASESNSGEQDCPDIKQELCSLWPNENLSSGPMPETVTVTLTQNPDEEGHHIISRIETHLSDGTTQVSTTLTPETAQLLSRLHPGLFPAASLLQLDTGHPGSSSELSSTTHGHGVAALNSSVGVHVINGHLATMVDVDASHGMLDSSLAMDSSLSENISGLIDSDAANLVNSEPHLSISDSGLTMDSATISEMVNSGAAHLSMVSGLPNTLALVTHKPESSMVFDSSDSDSNHLTLVEEDEKLTEELGMSRLEHSVSDL